MPTGRKWSRKDTIAGLAILSAVFGYWFAVHYPGFLSYRDRTAGKVAIKNADAIRIGLTKYAESIGCRCYPSELASYEAVRNLVNQHGVNLPDKQREAGFTEIIYKLKTPKSFQLIVGIDRIGSGSDQYIFCTLEKCTSVKEKPTL